MKKTQIVLVDDIDGTEAVDTISFSYEGINYEIDLNEEHIQEFTGSISKWIEAARRVGGRQAKRGKNGRGRGASASKAGLIREWAQGQGIAVNERGRISAEIVAAYEAAHA